MKPSKKQFLASISKKDPKKYALSLLTDLQSSLEEMKSYDLEGLFSTTLSDYNNAISLMEQAKNAADKYIESNREFEDANTEQWASYEISRDTYFEISNQLSDLGIEESSELSNYGNEVANGEEAGQKAFEQTQSEFPDHNELLDISNYN